MAAGVAHEINNPLAYILGNVDLVEEELAAERRRVAASDAKVIELDRTTVDDWLTALDDARTGAKRVRDIVRDMKTFARESDVESCSSDPRAAVRSSLAIAANEIRHCARLVQRLDEVPHVRVNESRLGQVVSNLIVNSAQAMDVGRAEANVLEVATFTDANGWAIVEVRDTGEGIASEHMGRIFDPFYTTKPVGSGTGLGLSICHNIVTEGGGHIEVESEPRKGTVVRLLLPPATQMSPPLVERPAAPSATQNRIMIVDDDPLVAGWVCRVLKGEHDVTVATRGRDCIARIERGETFDLILCDVMMPDLTGMDVYAAIGQVAPEQLANMVFISGGAFTSGARSFLDSIENAQLPKPFSANELKAVVADHLRRNAAS
jgi:CheY-like chemotaxis protein